MGNVQIVRLHANTGVSRIRRRACITPCSLMLAVVYLDQLRHRNPEYLASVSPCELFLVSMLVASKFLYDDGQEDEVFNGEWAASAGMDLRDLNLLERRFLDALVHGAPNRRLFDLSVSRNPRLPRSRGTLPSLGTGAAVQKLTDVRCR